MMPNPVMRKPGSMPSILRAGPAIAPHYTFACAALGLEVVGVLAAQQPGAPGERGGHEQDAESVHRAADRLRLAQQAEVAEHVDKVVRTGIASAAGQQHVLRLPG